MSRKVGQRRSQGVFRSQVRDPLTGKRRNITARSEAELRVRVERFQRSREALRLGEVSRAEHARQFRPGTGLALTVEDVWRRYREGVRQPSQSAADAAWRRLASMGDVPAPDLDEGVIRAWLARIEKGRSGRNGRPPAPRTILLAFDFLAAAFQQAVDAGLLDRVPWGRYRPKIAKIARAPREVATSWDELCAIVEAAKAYDRHEREARGRYSHVYLAIVVLALTGVRQAEAAGLAWSAVQIDQPVGGHHFADLRFQAPRRWKERYDGDAPLVERKGKRAALHVLHPSVVLALRYQRAELRARGWYRDDGPVFPARGGGWLETGQVVQPKTFRKIIRAAGLPNVTAWTPHSLRHSCATLEAVATGGDWQLVKARTGHSSLEQLQTYIHQAGRGLPVSRLPELPPALLGTVAPDLLTEGTTLAGGPPVLPVQADALNAPPALNGSAVPRALPAAEPEPSFMDRARAWLAAGSPGRRPPEVTEAAERARDRATQRALYDGRPREEARLAGARARAGVLSAWSRALRAVARDASNVSPAP